MNIECCKIPRPFPHSVRDKLIVLSEQNPTAFTLSIIASRLFKNIFYFPVYQPFRCLVKMDPTDCGKTVLALNQIFLKKQEFKLLRNLIRLRFPLQAVVNHQNYCFFDLFSSAAIVKAYQERKDDSLQTLNQKILENVRQNFRKFLAMGDLNENLQTWDFNRKAFQIFKNEIYNDLNPTPKIYNFFIFDNDIKIKNKTTFLHAFIILKVNSSFKILNSWKNLQTFPQNARTRRYSCYHENQGAKDLFKEEGVLFFQSLEKLLCRSSHSKLENTYPASSIEKCFLVQILEETSPYIQKDPHANHFGGITFFYTSHSVEAEGCLQNLSRLIEENWIFRTILDEYLAKNLS